MKTSISFFILLLLIVTIGSGCDSSRNAVATPLPTMSYEQEIQMLTEHMLSFGKQLIGYEPVNLESAISSLGVEYTASIQEAIEGKTGVFYASEWDLIKKGGVYYLIINYPSYFELSLTDQLVKQLKAIAPQSNNDLVVVAHITNVKKYRFYASTNGNEDDGYHIEIAGSNLFIIHGECIAVDEYTWVSE